MNALNRSKTPVPKFRQWAAAHGTPWEVSFPSRGTVKGQRRFFTTEEAANDAITAWIKGGTVSTLPKRVVDEVHYLRGLLPAGVSLTEVVRYYLEHNSGLTKTTLADVAQAYLLDCKRSNSTKYHEEMKRAVDAAVAHFGPTTLASALTKANLIAYIKAPESYYPRYERKRAVSVLISKARELEALRANPLDGWQFEDAPKATPHTLGNADVQTILEHVLAARPDLLASFALQLFAGIRTEELCRKDEADESKRALRWEDLSLGAKIEVPVEVSKTNDRRVITFWPAALTHWLNAAPGVRSGRICPVENLHDQKTKLLAELDVKFRQNDFRRTYASNAYALHGALVQDWMGHTDGRMLKRHYRDFVDRALAEAYFESKPVATHQNVVALTA